MVVQVQLLHETIPALRNSAVGFDLLNGIRVDQAKKLVDALNEYVLDMFVTVSEKGVQPEVLQQAALPFSQSSQSNTDCVFSTTLPIATGSVRLLATDK